MSLDTLQSRIDETLDNLTSNKQTRLQSIHPPGRREGLKTLAAFIDERLSTYAEKRNDPSKDALSGLSPYLHFGQLSALEIVLAMREAIPLDSSLQVSVDVFTEELVVRKELSDNWCYYNQEYDQLEGAPAWAQQTLAKHISDPREFLYNRQELEEAKTHDEAWNAAQKQLVRTGKIHGYMRMYWAKKVLEWSPSPVEAIETLKYLNDFYHIDGGDPTGYVGIMWSVAGVHDRPWGERPIYGTVRSMVYAGLKRKFNIEAYIEQNR